MKHIKLFEGFVNEANCGNCKFVDLKNKFCTRKDVNQNGHTTYIKKI